MATQAKGGFGTKLHRDDGSGVFTPVAEIMDVSGPEVSQVIEDATSMDSPNGWAEKIAVGLREAGDVTFQMNLLQDDTTQNALLADHNTSAKRNFRLVLAGGTKRWAFAGFVQKIGQSYPVRGKMINDVTITITGQAVKEPHP